MDDETKVILLLNLASALVVKKNLLRPKPQRKPRKYWVHPVLWKRQAQGHYDNLLKEMRLCDEDLFFNYTRLTIASFDKLLELIAPSIQKNSRREYISPGCRLAVTLRFLATGDSYASLGYAFRIAVPTICLIVKETCNALWDTLSPTFLNVPDRLRLKDIADDFYAQWQLPNCVGAIDGKHITIQAPPNSGSSYFNYKRGFSIVLMAACDANYNFTFVDIGAYGSQSDGGILNESAFGKRLLNNELSLPSDAAFPGCNKAMPFYFVGDEAFPLRINLMRPFSKSKAGPMEEEQRIYNYRLSRARRIIENTFGILAARFRIFYRVINAAPETVDSIIKACVCLHNFIKAENNAMYFYANYVDREVNGQIVLGEWRNDVVDGSAIQTLSSVSRRLGSRNACNAAVLYRNYIKTYVNGVGADIAPWQWNCVRRTT